MKNKGEELSKKDFELFVETIKLAEIQLGTTAHAKLFEHDSPCFQRKKVRLPIPPKGETKTREVLTGQKDGVRQNGS